MVNKNDVVIIELDRPREIRFGHKALKTYQALSGKSIEEIGQGGFDFADIERLVYAGLLSDAHKHGETLTIEQIEDLLDDHDIQDTISKMSTALAQAFSGTDPNAPTAGKKRK